jgi:sec-independent protein translocase protein TatA
LVVVLVLFGGAKIPQLMRGLGRGVSEFQEGIRETKDKFAQGLREAEAPENKS